jgi:signal transduction histidine kinase
MAVARGPARKPARRQAAAHPAPTARALRGLSARLAAAREEERTRLSRTLHDELGQMLTSLKLDLMWLANELTRSATDPMAASGNSAQAPPLAVVNRLQAVVGLVDVALGTVRRVSRDLRPPVLDHLGLAEAIRWEATVFEARTGIRCRVTAADSVRIAGDGATVLFRILQEALTNVTRHSHAGAVRIDVRERGRWVELLVRDNGRGISASQVRDAGSLGLLGMRERALGVGGELLVRGASGRGTTVTARVPRHTGGTTRTRSRA